MPSLPPPRHIPTLPNSGCLPAIRDDEVTELGFMPGNFTKIAAGNPYLIAQNGLGKPAAESKTSLT